MSPQTSPQKAPPGPFQARWRISCSLLPSLPHATAQKHGVEIAQLITLPSPMVRGTTGLSWWWWGCSGAPPRALHPKLGQAGHRAPLLPVQGRWRCRLMKHAGSSTKTSLAARQEHRGTADKQGQRASESSARLGRVPEEVPGREMEASSLRGEWGCPKYPEQRREGAPCLPHSRQRDALCVQDVSPGGNQALLAEPGRSGSEHPPPLPPLCSISPAARSPQNPGGKISHGERSRQVCAQRGGRGRRGRGSGPRAATPQRFHR